jgi:hypothetical protein
MVYSNASQFRLQVLEIVHGVWRDRRDQIISSKIMGKGEERWRKFCLSRLWMPNLKCVPCYRKYPGCGKSLLGLTTPNVMTNFISAIGRVGPSWVSMGAPNRHRGHFSLFRSTIINPSPPVRSEQGWGQSSAAANSTRFYSPNSIGLSPPDSVGGMRWWSPTALTPSEATTVVVSKPNPTG